MKGFKLILPILGLALIFGEATKNPLKDSAVRQIKFEPMEEVVNNNDTSPIYQYNNRTNGINASLIDSSMNGYGLIVPATRPLSVTPAGWVLGYRQWAGASGGSGQIGSAYSSDGTSWTTYTNLNPGMGTGRYPSSLGTPDYPYVFWNEYTGPQGNSQYGGKPYYAFDEFGWDGGSWSSAQIIDALWNSNKDHWVLSPDYSYDAVNDEHIFNVATDDWSRDDLWLFHSEAYFDGTIIFGSETMIIDEGADLVGGDDQGSYTSQAILDINDDGIGYVAVSAYFEGGDIGISPFANHHTLIFKMTEDFGLTWSGGQGGSPYYYIPDETFDYMTANGDFDLLWEWECLTDGQVLATQPFVTYDFDFRVDSNGDPHFLLGLIASDPDGVWTGHTANAIYHFTIDHNYVLNPGEPQTATGWNYSKVISTNDMWGWENANGGSYWQDVFPSLAISTEDENIMYCVIGGPNEGEFVVTDDAGTPDDVCDDLGYYPTWNEEIFVVKTLDGGQNWWCPYNASNTVPDCWVTDTGDFECADSEWCLDGVTQNVPDELDPHAGTGATDDRVNLVYNRPDWCYGSTTGDPAGMDHKARYYVGWVELTDQDQSFCTDCPDPGDVNGDTNVDILDIVSIVNTIVFGNPLLWDCAGDFNGDGAVDILDIVGIMNCILFGCGRTDIATYGNVIQNDSGLQITSDGVIGGVQMTLIHGEDFSIELTDNSYYGAYNTENGKTILVVVGPETEQIFTSTGSYEIESLLLASGDQYIDATIADNYALLSSYPNPFNPQTTITYELKVEGLVDLSIYNVLGQKVASLVNDHKNVGVYNVTWNGLDDSGELASSGLYLVKLTAGQDIVTNKITLLR
ncbi:MAG: T9SS type A sorting domain-containing protein [Fidelibacterota bacterium]